MTGYDEDAGLYVAVIGMAGRYPQVETPAELWDALVSQRNLFTTYLPVEPSDRIPAYGVVNGLDTFDIGFFDLTMREAQILDPQHRLMMECAWEAMEDAGHDPDRFDGHIGVYVGAEETYHFDKLRTDPWVVKHDYSDEELRLASDGFCLPSRVAYQLGATGPAFAVQGGCTTSLIAIHLAAQALIAGECELAVAGAASALFPHPRDIDGPPEGISSDGVVRAFDAACDGVVLSNGAGVVVLRRLDDALAAGDNIRAVIRGSAVHHDGARKVGFAGMSSDGLSDAMRAAYRIADVHPSSIDVLHVARGDSTAGLALEMDSIRPIYGPRGPGEQLCSLASIRGNVGHVGEASGVAALMMIVLMMEHELIAGTPNFTELNPELRDDTGVFTVSATPQPWQRTPQRRRRAAVSNSAHSGQNVHMVVEEPPEHGPSDPGRPYQLLPLSAQTSTTLARAADRMAGALEIGTAPLADVAWTLQVGRRHLAHRGFAVVDASGRFTFVTPSPAAAATARPTVRFREPDFDPGACASLDSLLTYEPVFREALGAATDAPAIRRALAALWRHWGITDEPNGELIVDLDPGRDGDALANMLRVVGQLWCQGVVPDWSAVHDGESRRRVALPTYPFDRRAVGIGEHVPPAVTVTGERSARPRWLLNRAHRPDAPIRAFMFPHSGGAPSEYTAWSQWLPDVDVWALQLPGRGGRIGEPTIASLSELVASLVADVSFGSPYVFFGHSFGGLVAFEVARALRENGLPGPQHLYISACPAPTVPDLAPTPLHVLDDAGFIRAMEHFYGPLAAVLHETPALMSLVLPAIRADMQAAETYQFVPGDRLSCPITVFGGMSDVDDAPRLRPWADQTAGRFALTMLDGAHFYFREDPDAWFDLLGGTLRNDAASRFADGR